MGPDHVDDPLLGEEFPVIFDDFVLEIDGVV
jgi:hypothetical protein